MAARVQIFGIAALNLMRDDLFLGHGIDVVGAILCPKENGPSAGSTEAVSWGRVLVVSWGCVFEGKTPN